MENWTPKNRPESKGDRKDAIKALLGQVEALVEAALDGGPLDGPNSTAVILTESLDIASSKPAGLDFIRHVFRMRRLRDRLFPDGLFADPCWDMLIDLYRAALEKRKVAVSSACIAAHVPPTTALRYIATMEAAGVLERRRDPQDGRRIYVTLTASAIAAMAGWSEAAALTPSGARKS